MNSNRILYKKATTSDYRGMLSLQKANFIGNLSEAEAQQGFLSIEYREEQFHEINTDVGIAVALHDNAVVGYLCAASFKYSLRFPILTCLMKNVSGRKIADAAAHEGNSFVYGPVCIDAAWRGSGVLAGLFETIKSITRPRYELCVLFVSDRNQRSLKAHTKKLGMQNLGTFEFAGKTFHMLGASIGL